MIKLRDANRGFTLVELMVALLIALIAMLAATELYVATRQTYRVQGMQSRLSEDGRFAQSMLQRIVLQAGYRLNPTWTIPAGYITPTSATAFNVIFNGDGASTVDCNGALVANAANAAATTTLTITGDEANRTLSCGGVNWLAPVGHGTELMDFLVEYGVDMATNSATANAAEAVTPTAYGCGDDSTTPGYKVRDCVADTYTFATAAANTNKIVAVRLCFVLRTEDVDSSVEKTGNYRDCSNTEIANSQNDHHLYRTFRSTILVRNR